MEYKVAICDDNQQEARFLEALVQAWAARNDYVVRTELFPSAEAFWFRYAEQKDYDILLLDIEMGEMDGVALAKLVRKDNETVQIVFVTGYSEYISEGYDVAALHYLMKPVKQEKLYEVLERAVQKIKKNEQVLVLEHSGETVRIPLYEIRYIEVNQNYVTVHAKREITVKKALKEFEDLLDERFYRVGRSFIINLNGIEKVTRTEIYLACGTVLPLPRGQYEPINRAIITRIS